MVDKELVKCETCGNMVEDTKNPFERGGFTVYRDLHVKRFEWCRNQGCITRAKKMAKEYLKFLRETEEGFICPSEGRIKEKENIEKAKEKYKKLYGWDVKDTKENDW
jgi:hypothetical protein